jgi:hypothetical protein
MVTKSSLVTFFLALCLVLMSADTLEFSEQTHHPVLPAIHLPVEPVTEPFVDLSIHVVVPSNEPSYDPPPPAGPLAVAKRLEEGDRPETPREKGPLLNTPSRTKFKIDFLKSLKKAGPKFSEPIHKVISASLACQTKGISSFGGVPTITDDKPDESSEPVRKILSASLASQAGWKSPLPGVLRITENKPIPSAESFINSSASINPDSGGEKGLTKFEILRSRMVKAEVFMLFRFSFGPKGEFAIEMNLDPTVEKGFGFSFPADTIRLPTGSAPSLSQTTGSPLF